MKKLENIKLIALDIDGTIMDEKFQISNRVKKAISNASKQGIKVVLATGRIYRATLPIAKSLNLDISVLMALFFQPVLATAMFIPISPGGLGFAEGGGALLFKILGYTPEAGAAFILLIRLNSILVDSIGLIDMRAKDKAK